VSRRRSPRDRIVELVRVRAGELEDHPSNWRRHPERQRAALRAVLREVGYADALLARRDGGRLILIDGHLRKSLGPDQIVPVLVLDVDEREADVLLATLDPLAALAEIDPEALSELLGSVQTSSAAVTELLDGLRRAGGLPLREVLTDPDEAPPLPEVPRTCRGDIVELGRHRLVCGDATLASDWERLIGSDRADLLWTDPPYGVGYVGKTPDALTIVGDAGAGLPDLLQAAFTQTSRYLSPGAAIYLAHPAGALQGTFLQAFLAQGWRLRQTLVWVKDRAVLGRSDYHYQHEPILYGYAPGGGRRGRGHGGWHGGNDQTSVLQVPRPTASREHPTMKPVELVARCLLNSSGEGDVVLEPFAGAGSTLIAAELHGRTARCLELDPGYCDVIVERWEALTGARARRLRRSRELRR